MTVRWSAAAYKDLEKLFEYIERDNLDAAVGAAEELLSRVEKQLLKYPKSGRPGKRPGTRELVRPPHIIVYRRAT